MSDELIKRLQPFMRKSGVYKAFFGAIAPEFASRDELLADIRAQMDVSTATWGLVFYEYEYGINTDPSKPLSDRRAAVMAKMRATGKFTAAMAHAIVSAFTDRVKRVSFTGRIRIQFDGLVNLNLIEVAAALDDYKPAHIDVEWDLGNKSPLVITEKITAHQRRYHKVHEFRVGMKLLKYQSEVVL